MPSKTELAFVVVGTRDAWMVHADEYVYGPYPSFESAVSSAIHEAQAAELLGFASVVLTQDGAGQPFKSEWTYDRTPPPRGGLIGRPSSLGRSGRGPHIRR